MAQTLKWLNNYLNSFTAQIIKFCSFFCFQMSRLLYFSLSHKQLRHTNIALVKEYYQYGHIMAKGI